MQNLQRYLIFSAVAAVALMSFALLFPAYNNLDKMKQRVKELEDELEARKTECMHLKKLLNDLENNPKSVEKVGREKFNMCQDGETIYTYNPKDLAPKKDKQAADKEKNSAQP